jgi:hypothetical protein
VLGVKRDVGRDSCVRQAVGYLLPVEGERGSGDGRHERCNQVIEVLNERTPRYIVRRDAEDA